MSADPLTDLEAATEFTKEHQHRPLHYKPAFNPQAGRDGKFWCFGSVSAKPAWGDTRCGAWGKVQLADGSWWCKTHCPAAVATRKAARDERERQQRLKYDADAQKRRELTIRNTQHPVLLDALKTIARGHNDPCNLAREVLQQLGETYEH